MRSTSRQSRGKGQAEVIPCDSFVLSDEIQLQQQWHQETFAISLRQVVRARLTVFLECLDRIRGACSKYRKALGRNKVLFEDGCDAIRDEIRKAMESKEEPPACVLSSLRWPDCSACSSKEFYMDQFDRLKRTVRDDCALLMC